MLASLHSPPGMAAALLEPMPKGALALHLPAPWGKGGATWWFETDAGVLLEAKPVAPVETTRTPRVRVVATSGGGGVGKQRLLFPHRTMLFLSRTLVGYYSSVITPTNALGVRACRKTDSVCEHPVDRPSRSHEAARSRADRRGGGGRDDQRQRPAPQL